MHASSCLELWRTCLYIRSNVRCLVWFGIQNVLKNGNNINWSALSLFLQLTLHFSQRKLGHSSLILIIKITISFVYEKYEFETLLQIQLNWYWYAPYTIWRFWKFIIDLINKFLKIKIWKNAEFIKKYHLCFIFLEIKNEIFEFHWFVHIFHIFSKLSFVLIFMFFQISFHIYVTRNFLVRW